MSVYGPPVPRYALTPEQNDNVREALRRLVANGETQTSLAEKLKARQGNISAMIVGRQGTSYPFAQRLAALMRVDVGELLGESEPSTAETPQLANFEKARRFLHDEGMLSPETARYAQRVVAPFPCDLEVEIWMAILKRFEQSFREGFEPPRREPNRPVKRGTSPTARSR